MGRGLRPRSRAEREERFAAAPRHTARLAFVERGPFLRAVCGGQRGAGACPGLLGEAIHIVFELPEHADGTLTEIDSVRTYAERKELPHGWVFSHNLMIDFAGTTPGVRAGGLRYLGFPDTGY